MKNSDNSEKNSVPSILAALKSYDGCEFDVRLTKDRALVLYHDAKYNGRRLLETNFKDLNGVHTLQELVGHPQVIESINNNGKTLWIETKEDTTLGIKRDLVYCQELARSITDLLNDSYLKSENIRIISFSSEILKHIKGFLTCRIVPYIFTRTDSLIRYYNHKTIFQMFISLRRYILDTKKMGINGLLFYKRYLRGFFSLFQPSLEEIKLLGKDNFILGTGVETLEEEKFFKDIVCVTDYRGERKGGRGKDAGPLICHRGL
ncbi:MAG: hypothetical protein GTN73_09515 [Candidatus Aminicenantes bacterium]|nr:hypothetical protein [Candidatus Aminicenantes bacterium]